MQTSTIQGNLLEATGNFRALSVMPRALPGCRDCEIVWSQCDWSLQKTDDGITIRLQFNSKEWSRELKMYDGHLQSTLQELEILRWIAEDENADAPLGLSFRHYDVAYQPQQRYSCLFPHENGATHDVLEIFPGMTEAEIDNIRDEAIADGLVILCPAKTPTCDNPSHDVAKEVHKLAALWPVRQIVSSTAVEGMIDIAPISVCRVGLCQSRYFDQAGRTSTADSPMVIRAVMPLGRMERTLVRIPSRSRANPEIAMHGSWINNVLQGAQSAVFRCQYRRANVHPTKLYDAHNREVSKTQVEHFLALSYCWKEWEEDVGLEDKLEELSRRLGIRYFWVDRWCIDQYDKAEKAREIPRMRDYYMGASGCVVLTGPDTEPFECLPQHDGAILSSFQHLNRNAKGLSSLISCMWGTRVWTLQEALLSRQVIYAIQDQLIDGDYISELISYLDTASDAWYDDAWLGGYGCYRWNARTPSVICSRQFTTDETGSLIVMRTTFGGEQQYRELQARAHGILMPLEEALTMISARHASRKEDYIYGVLGITEGGADINIEYEIEWPVMMDKLHRAGMITERQLAAPTVNESNMSWLPECGSRYGPFTNLERLAAPVDRPRLSLSEHGAVVVGTVFEWVEYSFERNGWDVVNIHGMACHVARGVIRFPEMPGLTAQVALTSTLGVTEERMRGTHVVLCQGVNRRTLDTVAMRVSGDIDRGYVRREDGFVLELHRWLTGSPESLKGRKWTLVQTPFTA